MRYLQPIEDIIDMNAQSLTIKSPGKTINRDLNLAQIMQYQNSDVISKFLDEWRVTKEEAQDVFNETKKFLFVAAMAQQQCLNLQIDAPILIIDKMWHTFILFTEEYSEFCHQNFGAMIHHMPFSKEDLKQKMDVVSREGRSFVDAKREHLNQQFEMILMHLGRETLEKWYVDFAAKYSEARMNTLIKPVVSGDVVQPSRVITSAMASARDDKSFIKLLTDSLSTATYCGTNCGVYCSCNSNNVCA